MLQIEKRLLFVEIVHEPGDFKFAIDAFENIKHDN